MTNHPATGVSRLEPTNKREPLRRRRSITNQADERTSSNQVHSSYPGACEHAQARAQICTQPKPKGKQKARIWCAIITNTAPIIRALAALLVVLILIG